MSNRREQMQQFGLQDIHNRKLTTPAFRRKGDVPPPDPRYNKNLSVLHSKVQSNDEGTFPFDDQIHRTTVASGATVNILDLHIEGGVEGVLLKYGWFTVGGDAMAEVSFGLYIGDTLILPGGRYISNSEPLTLNQFDPSGGSIAFIDLATANIYITPDTHIYIRCRNTGANDHVVWGRLYGRNWQVQAEDVTSRSFYNEQSDKFV